MIITTIIILYFKHISHNVDSLSTGTRLALIMYGVARKRTIRQLTAAIDAHFPRHAE